MNEIGEQLRWTRNDSGISLEEASNDLKIKEMILENIEEGNIGCFKDIFVLKEYIYKYAKYLGIDSEKMIDDFNEYLFEYTSKIPLYDIEKAVNQQNKESVDTSIKSPYTKMPSKYKKKNYIVIYILIAILVVLAIIWSIRQITVNNKETHEISYVS